MKPNKRSSALTVVLAAALAIIAAQPCAAQITRIVTTTDDDGGENTLRAALAFAEDGDTIRIEATGTLLLDPYLGPLVVDKSVTIVGPGKESLLIDGGNAPLLMNEVSPMNGGAVGGVFWVGFDMGQVYPDVTVSISGVTIAHGASEGGGGILNAGDLTLSECELRENFAVYGGAIANLGTLHLNDCTLTNNVAVCFGGAILNGTPFMSGGTPAATVTQCILSDNIVTEAGWQWGDSLYGGGAIANLAYASTATLSVEDSTLTGNSAQAGGAITNQSLGDAYSYTPVPAYAEASILRSTVSGNRATASENIAMGGAIFQATSSSASYATVIVENSTLDGNAATHPNVSGGGGICDYSVGVGTVIIRNSTLANNSAVFSEYSPPNEQQAAFAGAIAGIGSTLFVDNCTLSGNFDTGSPNEPTRVSGIVVGNGANITIKNTILANASSGLNLLAIPASYNSPGGTVTDLGFNVCTDGGSGLLTATGNQLNTDPRLGLLANNGGPTWTCALLPGSPAIDAADPLDSNGDEVTADQRGVSRPQGLGHDVGSFEATSALDMSELSVTTPNPKSRNTSVVVMIANPNGATAYNVTVTAATLGGLDTTASLPLEFGAVRPGTDKKCTLHFREVPSGERTLAVHGTSSLGNFFITQKVMVP